MEKSIETKSCKNCGTQFSITEKNKAFYDKISPRIGGQKFQIPNPTLCPDCRQQRRLARRNERKLYRRTCDASGKEMICLYSPDKKLKVYHYNEWRKDSFDPMKYGIARDPQKSFFKQFETLLHTVPRISTFNKMTENTEYGNNLIGDKNCYMLFITFLNEHCYYGHTVADCKNCVDMLRGVLNQNCYECVDTQNCYECFFCTGCYDCSDSFYLNDCGNVKNCAFCSGLRNKHYYFLNKEYAPHDYEVLLQKAKNDKKFFSQAKEEFKQLTLKTPVRSSIIRESEDCTGEYIYNSNHTTDSYSSSFTDHCAYCYGGFNLIESMDVYLGGGDAKETPSQLVYECENTVDVHHTLFSSTITYGSRDVYYSDNCESCKDCFGCIGLRHKQYCILNTQYSKEEYEQLVPHMIKTMEEHGEWGEFFPIEMSLFGYNETEAATYHPMSKNETIKKGRKWFDEKESQVKDGIHILQAKDIPDNIQDVDTTILDKILLCEKSGKPYRIIKQELDFYHKHNLPLPHLCPEQRHGERMKFRRPRKLRARQCAKCGKDITTTYSPTRPEIVYCETCYDKEIIG